MNGHVLPRLLALRPYLRLPVFLVSAGGFALAVGFLTQASWATSLWPYTGYYDDPTLMYVFLASVSAGIGAGALWIGLSGDLSAGTGATIDLLLTFSGLAIFLFRSYQQSGDPFAQTAAAACAGIAVVMLAATGATLGLSPRDTRPTPIPVRLLFALATAALVIGGISLLTGAQDVYPWDLTPETAALYGWIYLGAACYVIYALLRPMWSNARVVMVGLLVYDLVLLPPFLAQVGIIDPARRTSLLIYIAVLIVSAVMGCYYLFISRATRGLTIARFGSGGQNHEPATAA